MTKKEKKERIAKIVEKLKKLYPEALCSLNYEGEGWKLLIMGRLSAQCTDERVNRVCVDLFRQFPTARAIADADISELEDAVGVENVSTKKTERAVYSVDYFWLSRKWQDAGEEPGRNSSPELRCSRYPIPPGSSAGRF